MNWVKYARVLWDRTLAGVSAVIGGLLLLLGWIGVRDKLYVAQQIPYIVSGGLGGLFLLGVGATMWISADLRDEWRKLDAMQREWTGAAETAERVQAPVDRSDHSAINGSTNGAEAHADGLARRRLRPLQASGRFS